LSIKPSQEQTLLIAGAQKTGTTSLMGMLNCHPDIFILFECFNGNDSKPSKYGQIFLEKYPDARYLFRREDDLDLLYSQLREFFNSKGYFFKIVGNKFPGLNANQLKYYKSQKVIFTIRDIRTWLCKKSIIQWFLIKDDVVPTAIDYCIHFLDSFLLKKVLHIRMEDFILKNEEVIFQISNFLEYELKSFLDKWWEKIDKIEPSNPKASILQWSVTHQSSRVEPKNLDTKIDLRLNDFWKQILPVFDKYYQGIGSNFSEVEINNDIEKLKSIRKVGPVSLKEAYNYFETKRFEPEISYNKKTKKIIRKLLGRIYNKIDNFTK
jgi:hypothetical protein